MSKDSSHTPASLWKHGEWPNFAASSPSMACDVCIIGAGIAGLTSAYLMSIEGLRVIVLEAGQPGDGATGKSPAYLSSALDGRFTRLEALFGAEGSLLAAESHRWAIDVVESICLREGFDCGFQRLDGFLCATGASEDAELRREFEAALRAGFHDIELLHETPLRARFAGSAIRFPNQAQFHPLQYLQGLANAVEKYGGAIFMNHEATEIQGHGPYAVMTHNGVRIDASHVVVTSHTAIGHRMFMPDKQAALRNHVLAFAIEAGSVKKALYWDMQDPYHAVRLYQPSEQETLLIVSGEAHQTEQSNDPEASFARLEAWTREHFPEAEALVASWSGQVLEPFDSLALIGRNPGDSELYIATGDSGNGMTHGTIAGILINDLVQKRSNPWEKLYDPARKPTRFAALKEFFKENINVALQYKDHLSTATSNRIQGMNDG